jgi:hypothetical protein
MTIVDPTYVGTALAAFLFVAVVAMLEVGRRLALRRAARDGESPGTGALAGAVYGLLALLIAFTFSGAASRFDSRRQLVVEEANAIGTAYLRIDMAPPAAQPALRDSFRRYLDARIGVYRKLPDIAAARAELDRATQLQGEIWTQAVAACRMPDSHPSLVMLLLPALNEMIDITTTRLAALRTHQPLGISVTLLGLALAASLVAGYSMGTSLRRSWFHSLTFAVVIAVSLYVILDLEYPRLGFIRVDAADRLLVEVLQSMR